MKIPYSIKWSKVERVYGKTKIDRYPLCLAEKLHLIEFFYDIRLLNKRTDFINHCRHQNNLLLKNYLKVYKDKIVWTDIKFSRMFSIFYNLRSKFLDLRIIVVPDMYI